MMMIKYRNLCGNKHREKYTLILLVLMIYNVINIPVTKLRLQISCNNISGNIFGSPKQFAIKLCSLIAINMILISSFLALAPSIHLSLRIVFVLISAKLSGTVSYITLHKLVPPLIFSHDL